MRTFSGIDEFRRTVTHPLGTSEWLTVDQSLIDAFADATGDAQWIHVDPIRAATGRFGTTVAHGLLTLSLLPRLSAQIFRVEGIASRVNYGYDRIRFPAPVPAGSRVRAHAALGSVTEVAGGVRARIAYEVEIDGNDRPACVADALVQLMAARA